MNLFEINNLILNFRNNIFRQTNFNFKYEKIKKINISFLNCFFLKDYLNINWNIKNFKIEYIQNNFSLSENDYYTRRFQIYLNSNKEINLLISKIYNLDLYFYLKNDINDLKINLFKNWNLYFYIKNYSCNYKVKFKNIIEKFYKENPRNYIIFTN